MSSHPPKTAREPHAILDHSSRLKKAQKIIEQIAQEHDLKGACVLDVGCGGGVIAQEFGKLVGEAGAVWGVDLLDQRTVFGGYDFVQVVDTSLPFDDGTFDVVVTNHCIEHVGARGDQLNHLREISRILADDGICYLALPNRWVFVEPHFKLPLLSWLPRPLRSPYVRAARRGSSYDCDMPRPSELDDLIAKAGFSPQEVTVGAMRLLLQIEPPGLVKRMIFSAPARLLQRLSRIAPTRMFILRKARLPSASDAQPQDR